MLSIRHWTQVSCSLAKSAANQKQLWNEADLSMRIGNRSLMTWWQKTRLAAILLCGAGLFTALLISILMAALVGTPGINSVSWLTFSAFPLLAVVLVAALARLQQRFNLRSSGNYSPLRKSKEGN